LPDAVFNKFAIFFKNTFNVIFLKVYKLLILINNNNTYEQ
jgi:hypothetical protein